MRVKTAQIDYPTRQGSEMHVKTAQMDYPLRRGSEMHVKMAKIDYPIRLKWLNQTLVHYLTQRLILFIFPLQALRL